ncbi:bacterial low temperature requirement A protein-domain-containing protein [Durotheca rogersii]|uniref:bacterial low temperature requirement A protein-domain-containing protein n=1 Tax=Durotheca rogersii TaxID=419775 RepID=UPI0022201373|nr:bacterial low temperature requirement A protein-domain-containing protein [Durotheca rogersii]KAI5865627.1 bacterial low temperature requirement A protein-domain-containing protein [Durotheca rogersii]
MSVPGSRRCRNTDRILWSTYGNEHRHAALARLESSDDDTRRLTMGSQLTCQDEKEKVLVHERGGASNYELFYDLWFVANLNTFTSVHEITDKGTLFSFMGYVLLLWTTWFLTTIFDVRFGVDGTLQRITRGAHLAVMVGFAEAGSTFNPDAQAQPVFQAMSLFLMVSRFSLGLQHAIFLFRNRGRLEQKRPLVLSILFHSVFSITYFGVAFYTNQNPRDNVFTFWYYASVAELILHTAHAAWSRPLTLRGTHISERLNLLTLIILGEGVIILAKKVAVLVENTWIKDSGTNWSPALVGIIASAVALAYTIFQLYFDWMHEDGGSGEIAHYLWVMVHLPFHITLVLLVEGGNQFIVWRRAIEAIDSAAETLSSAAAKGFHQQLPGAAAAPVNTSQVVGALRGPVTALLSAYRPENETETWAQVREAFDNMAEIPDAFWGVYEELPRTSLAKQRWLDSLSTIVSAVFDGISSAFDIHEAEDEIPEPGSIDYVGTSFSIMTSQPKTQDRDFDLRSTEAEAYVATSMKFRLVFVYAFVCAGIVLLLLHTLHLLSQRQRWTPFNAFRAAFGIMVSIGLSLVSLVALSVDQTTRFLMTPWQLPIIAMCYFVCLVLTYLPPLKDLVVVRKITNWLDYRNEKKQTGDPHALV